MTLAKVIARDQPDNYLADPEWGYREYRRYDRTGQYECHQCNRPIFGRYIIRQSFRNRGIHRWHPAALARIGDPPCQNDLRPWAEEEEG